MVAAAGMRTRRDGEWNGNNYVYDAENILKLDYVVAASFWMHITQL